jgi:hypothetical protein
MSTSRISRWEQLSPLAGVAAVALWIAGLAITDAPDTSTHRTDAQILAVYQHHANNVIVGSWLFMLGCVFFLCSRGRCEAGWLRRKAAATRSPASASAAPLP